MTEWNCMDPDYPDRLCDYEDCEVECPYRKAREKLEAIKTWLKNAKAQGCISISDGMKLDEILGAEG